MAAYLDAVRLHLPRIQEGGSLASVLDHAMYCSMSLGRCALVLLRRREWVVTLSLLLAWQCCSGGVGTGIRKSVCVKPEGALEGAVLGCVDGRRGQMARPCYAL